MVEYGLQKDIDDKRSYMVAKANALIRKGRFDLSLGEQRALNFLISKIKPDANELPIIEFSVQEFCGIYKLDPNNGNNYKHVKAWLKSLRDKSWWISENGQESTMAWLQDVTITKNSGVIRCEFFPKMKPYLIALIQGGQGYYQFQLGLTIDFQSSYSMRMYELLKSYEYKSRNIKPEVRQYRTQVVDLQELKESLDDPEANKNLKKGEKPRALVRDMLYKDFRRRVLETSIQEINKYTDLQVSYEPVKMGRKVEQIKFTIVSLSTVDVMNRQAKNRAEENGIDDKNQVPGQMNFYSPISTTIEKLPD